MAATEKQLISGSEVCRRLGISKSRFWGDRKRGYVSLRSQLRAKGLKVVKIPSCIPGKPPTVRYSVSSLEKLINTAESQESLLC